jgi:hypothetical protein
VIEDLSVRDTAEWDALSPNTVRDCVLCQLIPRAQAAADREISTVFTHPHKTSHGAVHVEEWNSVPSSARLRATRALALAFHLKRLGWHPHQHRGDGAITVVESESTPGPTLCAADSASLDKLKEKIYLAYSETPAVYPGILHRAQHPDKGTVALRWASDERPNEMTFTRPTTADGAIIWRTLVYELAAGWAVSALSLSAGLVFLGPRQRFIYWPRMLNTLLMHMTVVMGSVFDLFTVVGTLGLKMDIKAAYRLILLDPVDAQFMGAVVDGVWIQFLRLPFGLGQSPAIFCALLGATIAKSRATMTNTTTAMSAFMDDLALAALNAAGLIAAADRLVDAFLADGWWISVAKIFLTPAARLLYIGLIVDFKQRTIQIAASKVTKLMIMLRAVERPTDAVVRTAPDSLRRRDSISAPSVTAASTASRLPGVFLLNAIGGSPTTWLRPPVLVFITPSSVAEARRVGIANQFVPFDTRSGVLRTIANCIDKNRRLKLTFLLIMNFSEISLFIPEIPIGWSTEHSFVIHYADTEGQCRSGGDLVLFDRQDSLPPFVCTHRRRELPLPAELMRPQPNISLRSREITPQTFSALSSAVGMLSWFRQVLPFIGFWLFHIYETIYSGVWSTDGIAAFDHLFGLAPMLSSWGRLVRTPDAVLTIVTDGGVGWGAFIPAASQHDACVRFAGILPPHFRLESSTSREAWAAVCAIRAAFALQRPFDSVRVYTDSKGGAAAFSRGRAGSSTLALALNAIANFAVQGLIVDFEWKERSQDSQPIADALSSAAAAITVSWKLHSHVVSFIWDFTGGWSLDMAASHETSWAPRYATPDMPVSERRRVLLGECAGPMSHIGWIGQTSDVTIGVADVAFCFPPWSLLPLLASRMRSRPFPLLLIAPSADSSESWWGPSIRYLAQSADHIRFLGKSVSFPPIDFRVPNADDPRPLFLYIFGVRRESLSTSRPQWWTPWRLTVCGDIHCNPGHSDVPPFLRHIVVMTMYKTVRGVILSILVRFYYASNCLLFMFAWMCSFRSNDCICGMLRELGKCFSMVPQMGPRICRGAFQRTFDGLNSFPHGYCDTMVHVSDIGYAILLLLSCGDIHPNPGPLSSPDQSLSDFLRSLSGPRDAPPSTVKGDPIALSGPPTAVSDRRNAPFTTRSRDRVTVERSDGSLSALLVAVHVASASQFAPDVSVALPPTCTGAVRRLPTFVPQRRVASELSVREWLTLIITFAAGKAPRIVDPSVPRALLIDVAHASAVVRAKAAMGSSRGLRAPRYLAQLARYHRLEDHMATEQTIAALCTAYAVQRVRVPPPFGWYNCGAAAALLDLSAISMASRRAGVPLPPYCGSSDGHAFLVARGANDKKESSAAWPLHVSDLMVDPPVDGSPDYLPWCALMVGGLFCLRTGILFNLTRRMFLSYMDGYILIWRHVTKRSKGDILDPSARSRVAHVTAAKHAALPNILSAKFPPGAAGAGVASSQDAPLFPGLSWAAMNDFVRKVVPDVPVSFDIRSYGIRVAADTEAMELGVPGSMVDGLFWWRRETPAASKTYYSGLNIRLMFLFSEARQHMRWRHITPARYYCVLTRAPPIWTAIACAETDPPLPPLDPVLVDLAWEAEAPYLADRRWSRVDGSKLPAWTWDSLPSSPPPGSVAIVLRRPRPVSDGDDDDDVRSEGGYGSDLSVDCSRCAAHISRHRRCAMCDDPDGACRWALCRVCCPSVTTSVYCPRHVPLAVRAAQVDQRDSDDDIMIRTMLSVAPAVDGSVVSPLCPVSPCTRGVVARRTQRGASSPRSTPRGRSSSVTRPQRQRGRFGS